MEKIEIKIDPHADLSGGLMASCSWEQLIKPLNVLFALKPSEKIVGVIVSAAGIKVKIEHIKS